MRSIRAISVLTVGLVAVATFLAATPANAVTPITEGDDFGDAVVLTGFTPTEAFDTRAFDTQSGEPRTITGGYSLRRTAWIKWKAPASGAVSWSAETGNPLNDTGLAVYTGSTLASLVRVASNDDQYMPVPGAAGTLSGPSLNSQILSMNVKKGTTYYIQAGNATKLSSTSGSSLTGFAFLGVSIVASRYLPTNDDLADAEALNLGTGFAAKVTGVLTGATLEAWEPTDNDEAPSSARVGSIWYKWTAPQDGDGQAFTCFSGDSPTVAVFSNHAHKSGNGKGDLQQLDFDSGDNDNCVVGSGGAATQFAFIKGVNYYIQVSEITGGPGATGQVGLDVAFSKPYIAYVSPNSGSLAGGETVTIRGDKLKTNTGTPVVKFGTKTAVIISKTTGTIKVKVPAGVEKGVVKVTVTSAGKTSNYRYYTYK
jgi:hypothetical protein